MAYETIEVSTTGEGVANLVLSRTEKHNALSSTMISELTDASTVLGNDPSLRAVILSARGDSFCAGGDLGWMKEQFSASRQTRMEEARKLAVMLKTLNEIPKFLVGRIHGNAFGGGIGMMSVCDVAIAADGAKFGLTETRLGLIPATISPYVVARVGEGMARRIFMSARLFGTEEAIQFGLVARSVPADALDAAIEAEIRPCLAAAPGAIAASKRLTRMLGAPIGTEQMEATISALADTWENPESHEGVSAFFEKRKPNWSK
ncbi:MAG: crotonase/enoyl-CoA hydratase family protein [Rhizobiaceae bacterium]